VSSHRASSIFICQSTQRWALLTSDDQAVVSARRADLVIVTNADEAVIVFEGEESRNGISPNLILADMVSSLLADRLELEGKPPRPICLDRTTCVVAFHQRAGDDRTRSVLLEEVLRKTAGASRPANQGSE